MSIDIRQPNIQGTDHEMLLALRSYLFQLREQLQYAFDDLEKNGTSGGGGSGTAMTTVVQQTVQGQGGISTPQSALELFNSIKAYIITSGEIVDAYYKEIDQMILESKRYVVENFDGKYKETVEQRLLAHDGLIEAESKKIETIEGTFSTGANYAAVISSTGTMKLGFIEGNDTTDTSDDVYGMEITLKTNENGVEKKSAARFTTTDVKFLDADNNTMAEFGSDAARMNNIEARRTSKLGGFKDYADENGDVITKVVGRTEI